MNQRILILGIVVFIWASAPTNAGGIAEPPENPPRILADSGESRGGEKGFTGHSPISVQTPKAEIPTGSAGGPVWQLSDLIEKALKENPELGAFQERWKAAKARVWQAMSWDDTSIGADFEGIPSGHLDPGKKNNIEWMISQKIPFPGKRFLRGRVAAKEAKMREADYHAKEREIISEIKKAYFEYFLREHEYLNHKASVLTLERLSKSAESRYATGQVPYHEVLRAHTELAKITNDVAKHDQQREIARARLNALMGGGTPKRGEAPSGLFAPPLRVATEVPDRKFSYTREGLMKLALENRPELRAMHFGLEAAKTDATRAWLDLLPDGEYRIEARQFSGEGKIREYDHFFGFEVPVFSLLGRVGQIKEKRAEKRAAQGVWENMKNMVLFEVQQALAEFESEERTVKIYESNVLPQAQSAVEVALSDYEGGRGNFLAVMEAERALREFRHEYYHGFAMREQSFAELERVVGIDLGGGVSK